MSSIAILGGPTKLVERIRSVPGHDVVTIPADALHLEIGAERLASQMAQTSGGRVAVVVLGEDLPLEVSLHLAQLLDRGVDGATLVLVAEPDADVALRAMRSGIREIIPASISQDELVAVLYRMSQLRSREVQASPSQDESGVPGRIITVTSAKGGVGKSSVATNLAAALATHDPMEVVLVDLDAQFGDVATLLDLTPDHGVTDAIDSMAESDSVLLKTFLTPHSSGLLVLGGASTPSDGDSISADAARDLLRLLVTLFPTVVVDTSAGLLNSTLGAVEAADELVLVTSMEVTSIRGLRKELDVLDQLALATAKRHLVLNMVDRRSGLTVRDVEATVGMPVDASLPRFEEALLAANHGQLVVSAKRPAPWAKGVVAFADRFQVPVEAERKRRGKRRRKGKIK